MEGLATLLTTHQELTAIADEAMYRSTPVGEEFDDAYHRFLNAREIVLLTSPADVNDAVSLLYEGGKSARCCCAIRSDGARPCRHPRRGQQVCRTHIAVGYANTLERARNMLGLRQVYTEGPKVFGMPKWGG